MARMIVSGYPWAIDCVLDLIHVYTYWNCVPFSHEISLFDQKTYTRIYLNHRFNLFMESLLKNGTQSDLRAIFYISNLTHAVELVMLDFLSSMISAYLIVWFSFLTLVESICVIIMLQIYQNHVHDIILSRYSIILTIKNSPRIFLLLFVIE